MGDKGLFTHAHAWKEQGHPNTRGALRKKKLGLVLKLEGGSDVVR